MRVVRVVFGVVVGAVVGFAAFGAFGVLVVVLVVRWVGGDAEAARTASVLTALAGTAMGVLLGYRWGYGPVSARQPLTATAAPSTQMVGQGRTAPAPADRAGAGAVQQLESLAQLYRDGLLTREEFDAARTRLLG